MIDFRYHIVSLVAVFLALAVGIVLGAGPLREELGNTLESQVSELRDERALLRAELDDTQLRNDAKDELVSILAPVATQDRLADTRVGIVMLPGADNTMHDTVSDTVARAGGQVVATTWYRNEAEDPELAATRHELAQELAALVGDPEPREGSEPTLGTVLAAVIAGVDEPGQSGQWAVAQQRLEELDFVEVDRDEDHDNVAVPGTPDLGPPDAVVVISGGLSQAAVEQDEDGAGLLAARLDLVAALGAIEMPTVVLGYGTEHFENPEGQTHDALLQAVRGDGSVADTVATVDNGDSYTGQVALVLTLGQALVGQFGQWGVGPGAEGVAPQMPASRAVDGEGPTGPVVQPPVATLPPGSGMSPTEGEPGGNDDSSGEPSDPAGDTSDATATP